MRGKDVLLVFAIFGILAGVSSITMAMASPVIEYNSDEKITTDCGDLSEDLQFLVENGIITQKDAKDALFVFYCGL